MYNGPWFYPDPVFGWTFYAVLLGFLAVATYADLGTLKIPKAITLPMLGVGLAFNLVRGAWMGSLLAGTGARVWHFASSPAAGAVDGLLCSLEGFAAGFALFFALWLLGHKKGGDVKLVAALGAWVGPVVVLLVVLGTIPIVLVLGTVLLIRKARREAGGGRHKVPLVYALPVALSAGVLLAALVLRDQCHHAPPKPGEQAAVRS